MVSTRNSRPFSLKGLAASLAFAVALTPMVSSAEDADAVAAGKAIYAAKACMACHGPQGRKPLNNDMPIIAGQNRNYLVMQIKGIRSGDRDSGNAIQMKGIAQTLTDDDIESIADYLSSQVIAYAD